MPKILIVDDEKENRLALKRALEDENPDWEILLAAGEKQGIAILEAENIAGAPVDVVLTDLVMKSETSGMTMLQRARSVDPHVMAILFTAKEKSLDRYAALDYGAFDVVEKNIRGASAVREINIKTRAALRYREWFQRINFLKRYFDPKLFDAIEREPNILGVRLRTVTIAFWDIRGFSLLCETLKAHPTLIADFLREYCDIAAQIVFKNSGVLDKFIGDGVMALFGVLQDDGDDGKADAVAACHAATEMRSEFLKVYERWMKEWRLYTAQAIDIGLGCGLHTGEVLVGNVGTTFRDQFTALGPHVNLAARIESRSLRGQILLSQSTEARVGNAVKLGPAGQIEDIKNIPGTYKLFEIQGP